MPSKTYEFLKNIAQGKVHSRWDLDFPDDEIIYSVKLNDKNPSMSTVTLKFESEKFLEVLGVTDNEDIWVWNTFMGNYYSGREYDWYRYNEDWNEGYIINDLNDENKELLKEIMSYLTPGVRYNLNENKDRSKVSKYLEKRYERSVEDIIDVYATEQEECKERAVKKELENETKNPFSRFGIVEVYHSFEYKTKVGILISLFHMLKGLELDTEGLLKKLIEKYDKTDRGYWYELEYSVWCDDYNRDYVDNQIKEQLENILEQVKEELEEGGGDIEEFNKLVSKIEELGGFNNFIDILDKNIRVKFIGIDPETNKVIYKVQKKSNYDWEDRSLSSVDELNTLLYNYELFETIRKILRRI